MEAARFVVSSDGSRRRDGLDEIMGEPKVPASVAAQVSRGLLHIPADGLALLKQVDIEVALVADDVPLGAHDAGAAEKSASGLEKNARRVSRSCPVANRPIAEFARTRTGESARCT